MTDGYGYLKLDPDFTGACPCAWFELDGTSIEVHCWRACTECLYSGVHFEGDRAVAERVAEALNAHGWSSFEVREGLRR